MKPVTIDIPHSTGKVAARQRIEGGFHKLAGFVPGGKVTEHRWEGHSLFFAVEALGQRVAARLGQSSDVLLTITVRTKAGKVLATRTVRYVAIPYKDPVWTPLWVNNIQCAGQIVATAIWGKQRRTTSIRLDCGE